MTEHYDLTVSLLKITHFPLVFFSAVFPWMSLAVHPLNRMNVIGQYPFVTEMQCRRMCWYRRLCSSYSWNEGPRLATRYSSDDPPNCVLHSDSVPDGIISGPSLHPEADWTESPASDSTIHNACRPRPCDDLSVCVLRPPLTSNSSPSSFYCLPLPAQCRSPPAVPNGKVSVLGTQQGDTAHVTCDPSFAVSPKGVSSDIVCQVTSTWTPFSGTCVQYEFHPGGSQYFIQSLPWPVEDCKICVKGVFTEEGQMTVNFLPDFTENSFHLHIMFKYKFAGTTTGVWWTTKVNDQWQSHTKLGEMPLTPGDFFIISLQQMSDHLHMTVNTSHVFQVPLSSQGGIGVDLSQSKVFMVEVKIKVNYVNLVYGC